MIRRASEEGVFVVKDSSNESEEERERVGGKEAEGRGHCATRRRAFSHFYDISSENNHEKTSVKRSAHQGGERNENKRGGTEAYVHEHATDEATRGTSVHAAARK
jgi:hypothetical protein